MGVAKGQQVLCGRGFKADLSPSPIERRPMWLVSACSVPAASKAPMAPTPLRPQRLYGPEAPAVTQRWVHCTRLSRQWGARRGGLAASVTKNAGWMDGAGCMPRGVSCVVVRIACCGDVHARRNVCLLQLARFTGVRWKKNGLWNELEMWPTDEVSSMEKENKLYFNKVSSKMQKLQCMMTRGILPIQHGRSKPRKVSTRPCFCVLFCMQLLTCIRLVAQMS